MNPRQHSKSYVDFQSLKFQGQQKTKSTRYELDHLQVAINTTKELTETKVKKPFGTRAVDRETKETNASKDTSALSIGGTLLGIFGVPTANVTVTGTRTNETSLSAEVKKFNSRITQFDSRGIVRWGFSIDDPYEKARGIGLTEDTLPSVEFEFLGDGAPPPPPEFLRVEVTSCWSLISGSKRRVPSWLSQPGQSTSKVPSYSVLCQVVVLEIPTRHLSEPSKYMATLDMKSIDQIDVKLPGSLKVIPAIRRFTDPRPGESGTSVLLEINVEYNVLTICMCDIQEICVTKGCSWMSCGGTDMSIDVRLMEGVHVVVLHVFCMLIACALRNSRVAEVFQITGIEIFAAPKKKSHAVSQNYANYLLK
jgi:hypothetical protein